MADWGSAGGDGSPQGRGVCLWRDGCCCWWRCGSVVVCFGGNLPDEQRFRADQSEQHLRDVMIIITISSLLSKQVMRS